jgi:tetratricopeptide (TPR) repeat protein
VLAYDAKEPEKAQRYLDSVLAIEPTYPDAAVLRSQIAVEEGNMPFARRLLETQIGYRPDHPGLREALAGVCYLERDLEGARASLAAAEALHAPAWRVAFHRGLLAEFAGDGNEAQRQYQLCTDANPDFTPARARLDGARALGGYNAPTSPPGKKAGGG